jgi:hypothetical protein
LSSYPVDVTKGKNKLKGFFPQSFAMLVNLEMALFSHNQLEGFDGAGVWNQLPKLKMLRVEDNLIIGEVGEWGKAPSLETLDICKCHILTFL